MYKMKAQNLQGSQDIQMIPLVIRYAAGAPAVLQNPSGEVLALTDNGTGDVTITLTSAALAPLIVAGLAVRSSAPATAGVNANISGATSTTVVRIVCNADTDGATETDPVDLHLLIMKQVQA